MYSKVKKVLDLLRFLRNVRVLPVNSRSNRLPVALQFPITSKCNNRCVMCNVWNMENEKEMSIADLKKVLSGRLCNEVKSVGINGGEPFLNRKFNEYVDEVIKLPSITSLNVISNGYSSNLILETIKNTYIKCRNNGIKFNIIISLDGIEGVHDVVRGVNGAFEKVKFTMHEINTNLNKYCDSFSLACTVVQQNVEYLSQLDSFATINGYKIKYRIGISNKRIQNNESKDQYSVLKDGLQSAKEFFHYKYYKSISLGEQFKYFALFQYLNKNMKRLLGCIWQERGITIDCTGKLFYCAVESRCIGELLIEDGAIAYFKKENIQYRRSIIKTKCDGCIHDYSGKIFIGNVIPFILALIEKRYSMLFYRIRCRLECL